MRRSWRRAEAGIVETPPVIGTGGIPPADPPLWRIAGNCRVLFSPPQSCRSHRDDVKNGAALILIVAIASAAPAQQADEDSAHRSDRERTEALNRRVADQIARRNQTNANGQESYKAATARYARELQEWRRRVAACREGYYDACG
jgi:hypothetical protein